MKQITHVNLLLQSKNPTVLRLRGFEWRRRRDLKTEYQFFGFAMFIFLPISLRFSPFNFYALHCLPYSFIGAGVSLGV